MAARTTTTIETTKLMKLTETVGCAIGPAITAYYATNFTVDQHGYYIPGHGVRDRHRGVPELVGRFTPILEASELRASPARLLEP